MGLRWAPAAARRVPVVALSVVVLACHTDPLPQDAREDDHANTTSRSRPTQTADDPASPRDPQQRLLDAFGRLSLAYPYRSTDRSSMSSTLGDLPEMISVTEHAAADRTRVTWRRGADSGTIISLGPKTYVQAAGRWADVDTTTVQRAGLPARRELPRIRSVRWVDVKVTDGVPVDMYVFSFQSHDGGLAMSGSGKAWVGRGDGLLRRAEFETGALGIRLTSRVVYEYQVPITIERPVVSLPAP